MKFVDEFGFAAAGLAGLNMFETTMRGSGRTSRMIERLTDNDQLIVATPKERERIERLLRKAGKSKVRVYAVEPTAHPLRYVGTAPAGRTYYEHTWVYAYFTASIVAAARELTSFQREMSKTWPEAPDLTPQTEHMIREWVY